MVESGDQGAGGEPGVLVPDPRGCPGNNLRATGSRGRPGVRDRGTGGAHNAPGRDDAPGRHDAPDGREEVGVAGVYAPADTRPPGVTGVSGGAKKLATRLPITKPDDTDEGRRNDPL